MLKAETTLPEQFEPFAFSNLPATEDLLRQVRQGQRQWADVSLRRRLGCVRKLRDLLARDAKQLTGAFSPQLRRSPADSLTAEVIPLAEAARFLEQNADEVLRTRRLPSKNQPLWLKKVDIELRREPIGVVLVIGPSNYPLFLPGVQTLQALAAGNAVLLKPGRDGQTVALALRHLATEAGIPENAFLVLEESIETARAVLRAGVDKVVMTGSATAGASVLKDAAEQITPAVMELSGCDAVFIRSDADIPKAVEAIVFGLTLNGSATCIAPRRVFVDKRIAEHFERMLTEAVQHLPAVRVSVSAASLAEQLIRDALSLGARLAFDRPALVSESFRPVVILDVLSEMAVVQSDLFAPVLSIIRVNNDKEAIDAASICPYALGATVFGEERAAKKFAECVPASVVVVNDMIMPTADPRLPFGGTRRSGFGKTRGAEGLLEMTNVKAIVVQRGKRLRHMEPTHPHAEDLFLSFLAATHRRKLTDRLRGWRSLGNVLRRN